MNSFPQLHVNLPLHHAPFISVLPLYWQLLGSAKSWCSPISKVLVAAQLPPSNLVVSHVFEHLITLSLAFRKQKSELECQHKLPMLGTVPNKE